MLLTKNLNYKIPQQIILINIVYGQILSSVLGLTYAVFQMYICLGYLETNRTLSIYLAILRHGFYRTGRVFPN